MVQTNQMVIMAEFRNDRKNTHAWPAEVREKPNPTVGNAKNAAGLPDDL
jgi:hypothetical protein